LADVAKSKNESAAQSALRDEAAKRERELQDQNRQDMANMQNTLAQLAGQAIGALGQGAGRPAISAPGADGTTAVTVRICTHCRAENKNSTAKFCSNCGKEL
jgi:hypothetical protein